MAETFPRIIELLGRTIRLLQEYGVPKWPGALADLRSELERAVNAAGAAGALSTIREMTGVQHGVGSFGDVYIEDQAGHSLPAEDIRIANTQLEYLRHELFLEASKAIEQGGSPKPSQVH
jgi:hypothetical protein